MKTQVIATVLLVVVLMAGALNTAHAQQQSKIQIALLLDTSSSMDGLIEQAKSQLWKIVNELALAEYKDEPPVLEIALYEYGNDNLAETDGYLREISPLTTDLDKISEDLFSLSTYGGYEYCGEVIRQAVEKQEWSGSDSDLKLIFIAGNEEFNQGETDYKTACKSAIEQGIIVNTIFCGAYDEGINILWKEGAELADGDYMNIDHNQQTTYIETPFDEQILELNQQLNQTYIGYGTAGEAMRARQVAQDVNAAEYGSGNVVNRAVSKSTSNYQNAEWDLVDAVEDEAVELEEIPEEQLPEELQGKTEEEKLEYIEEKRTERTEIQEQINDLNMQRRQYIAQKQAEDVEANSLDAVMLKAIREQAEAQGYRFKD